MSSAGAPVRVSTSSSLRRAANERSGHRDIRSQR